MPLHENIARVGASYRHFKGGTYTVRHIATHSETGEMLVIYTGPDGMVWARPRQQFEDGRYRLLDVETQGRLCSPK